MRMIIFRGLYVVVFVCWVQFLFGQENWTMYEINSANTACDIEELSNWEKDVILYMNLARMYPQKYARVEVEPYDGGYKFGHVYRNSSYKASLLTELRNRKAVVPLKYDHEMYVYAKCWAIESGQLGLTGHDRVRCADLPECSAECCAYGPMTGQEFVVGLLIDQDVPNLGHRKIILDGSLTKAGASIQPHTKYESCCVINFTYTDHTQSSESNVLRTSNLSSGSTSIRTSSNNSMNRHVLSRLETTTSTRFSSNNTTVRNRYYEKAGKSHLSFLSLGAKYHFDLKTPIVDVGTLNVRIRMFCLNLFDFELANFTGESYDGYGFVASWSPSIGVVMPLSGEVALGVVAGAVMGFDYIKYNVITFKEEYENEGLPRLKARLSLQHRNYFAFL